MKLAKELITLMSNYYALNQLGLKLYSPPNQEYMEVLKIDPMVEFLSRYEYLSYTNFFNNKDVEVTDLIIAGAPTYMKTILKSYQNKTISWTDARKESFHIEIELVPNDLLTKVDLVVKGAMFLYFNEILSWNEVKVLLNIDSTGVILYKLEVSDNLGAYDIILTLLSVLFGKVSYTTVTPIDYDFKRLTNDIYYWNQPTYYYGYKNALSYTNVDGILDNIDWFISETPEIDDLDVVPDRVDILGMLRINNKFCQTTITNNKLEPTTKTEMDNLGLYNVILNLIRVDEDVIPASSFGLGNILFDFYKATKETTVYSDDYLTYETIDWEVIRTYSKYIDNVLNLDSTYLNLEKMGNIIRNIQNFLIH